MSITVHGRFQDNGTVFCDLPACVEYCAVPVWTGEHAGQVALTLSDATNQDCNDTFYGCVDFATGKFEVLIPDNCCEEIPEYGLDCCQFLDPDTPDWSSVVTYNLGDIVERIGYGTYRSTSNNNLNHQPPNTDWWFVIANVSSCGCENWNSHPPYGGIGKTPAYAIIQFSGITDWDDACDWPLTLNPNKTYILLQQICDCCDPYTDNPCYWTCQISSGEYPYFCTLLLTKYGGNFLLQLVLSSCNIELGEACSIFVAEVWDICGGAVHGQTFNNNLSEGGTAHVTFANPPSWGPWVITVDYVVGDMVIGSDTQIYSCQINHTSTLNDRPITGANWQTYWALCEGCSGGT